MGIPPQPWQLKTFEDKYTPYFRPTHALPVPGFYATRTLTNTIAFPPERRPTSVSGRLQSATDTWKADYHKKTTPVMGNAAKVLDVWSELYRPKKPVVSPSHPTSQNPQHQHPNRNQPTPPRPPRSSLPAKNVAGKSLTPVSTHLTPFSQLPLLLPYLTNHSSISELTEDDDDKDPTHLRAYGELGKLKKLADLMERPSPPASSDVWLRLGVGV